MKSLFSVLALSIFLLFTSFSNRSGWVPLLDKNLSKWEMYLSFRFHNDYQGKPPVNEEGDKISPIGYSKDEARVVSVKMVDGEPVLRISGEIYGCVYTKEVFENYDLKLMVKFGDKKWTPRTDEPRSSGLLYNSQGEAGVDYWRSWMLSQEFEIMEDAFGDYWCVGASGAHVKMHDPNAHNDMGIYDIEGIDTPMGVGGTRSGFVQHSHDYEKRDEWNTIELICFGDKSLHIVNGHVVMALTKSVYKEGDSLKPLVKGRIQLQSEGAEVFYKRMQIKKIDRIPEKYAVFFK